MSHVYRYVNTSTGEALIYCPECNSDLTIAGNVRIELTDGTSTWGVPSRLKNDGCLVDVGGLVAVGLHSATRCRLCGEMLINMRDVDEQDIRQTA